MNTMKNILLAVAIISTTFSYSIVPGRSVEESKMTKEDSKKLKTGLMLGGAVTGGMAEAVAVWRYAQHSPSTSKARIPLRLLTASVAAVGGMCVGIAAGEMASDVITERLMRDASASELLMPHDPKRTEEIVIEKS